MKEITTHLWKKFLDKDGNGENPIIGESIICRSKECGTSLMVSQLKYAICNFSDFTVRETDRESLIWASVLLPYSPEDLYKAVISMIDATIWNVPFQEKFLLQDKIRKFITDQYPCSVEQILSNLK